MKKKLALLLASSLMLGLTACGGGGEAQTTAATEATAQATEATGGEETEATEAEQADGGMDALIEAAKAEGELTVYGSCEEEYLSAACKNFEELYGIKTKFQRLSTSEVYTKISEEAGKPSADVWFGGTTDPYNEAVADGLLMEYEAANGVNLISEDYKDPTNCWYGIYKGIMLSNPNTAGTAKLVINTMIQMRGHDEAMEYFKKLDQNINQYTKSGSGPSKMVGPGECVIGIGFLHDGIYQILQGYENIELIVPEDGTSFEVGATAIFNGCAHPNAAKLWIEYALSPECVDHAKEAGSYQFLVLSNATQPEEATRFGLDMNNTIDYDFEDAKANSAQYVEDFFAALGSSADSADSNRFKTE